jgi:hypothetical protein
LDPAIAGVAYVAAQAAKEKWKRGQHPRRKGPGISHFQGRTVVDRFDSTDARAESFKANAPDAPKKASRTMPAAWGQPFMGGAR